jgi:RNA polymerase primary sigma factor
VIKEAGKGSGREEIADVRRFVELGEEQGYVLLDDILKAFPQVEENLDLLEDIFDELLSAGIPYSENGVDQLRKRIVASRRREGESGDTTRDDSKDKMDRLAEAVDAGDLMGVYLNQASRVPLLNREEEVALAKRIEQGRNASKKMVAGSLSSKKRDHLQHRIEVGLAAREHLILANVRLVFSVAKKYVGRGVPLMDLVQEGHIGLMRAAKKFDCRRGYKFSTYATWWIRQAITRALANQARTIRLPVHMGEKISKMYQARHQLIQALGRDPTMEELAKELGESPSKVREMTHISRRTLSLGLPVGDEEDAELGDFIEDTSSPSPEESVAQNLLEENIQEVLEALPARDVRVLQLRFGLRGERIHTLREVGKKMMITRERVRQIQARALRRLQKLSRMERLVVDLGR